MSVLGTAIIIQARMGSVRLPGKSLMPVAGIPLIKRCYQQCLNSSVEKIIVATASTFEDQLLYDYLCNEQISVYQGDSDNLVKRYYQAANHFSIKNIVRITGDNPMVAPDIIDRVLQLYQDSGADYATTRHWNGHDFQSNLGKGLAVDIFSLSSLESMLSSTLSAKEQEHIVYYFVNHQSRYKIVELTETNHCPYELSVDTKEDLERLEKIIYYFEKHRIEFCYSNYCERIKEILNV